MNINRTIATLGCTLFFVSSLSAQSTQPAGPEPGSQSSFVNGKAAARNAFRPNIWLGASVQAHQDFYANAFNGPNITEVDINPDLDSALKAEVISTILDSANLALIAASQQFLADLEAANQDNDASDPIGEGPLDDFFGDIGGTGSSADDNADPTPTPDSGDSLTDDEIDDFFGPLGSTTPALFDEESAIDPFADSATKYTFEPIESPVEEPLE